MREVTMSQEEAELLAAVALLYYPETDELRSSVEELDSFDVASTMGHLHGAMACTNHIEWAKGGKE